MTPPPSAAKEDGGPAFPTVVVHWNKAMVDRGPGMSLRDWFAGQALAGVCAYWGNGEQGSEWPAEEAAHEALRTADALLALLAARNGGREG